MNIDAANPLQATLNIPLANQPIPPRQEAAAAAAATTATMPVQPQVAAAEAVSEDVSLNITVPRQTLETLERVSSVTDLLNNTAKAVRATGNSLKLSTELIDKMKDSLSKIIKNFPPFPPESAERRELLMSYQSIREQIMQMTVPAPPAPAYERIAELWTDLFPEGRRSVNTPSLTSAATDLQVKQAAEQLTITRAAVTKLGAALGKSF
ncbi:MAG: hypothetical protein RBQ99_05185 [Trichlorobacter sp.]|jgi:hypothetical protein|nr:hypothetical protein [Trichlorobacter sp.]